MFGIFSKNKKPLQSCIIDISLINLDQNTLNKLKESGTIDLIFKDAEVHHKKYGYIGIIPDKKYKRLNELENFTYYWNTFLKYNDGNGDIEKVEVAGKGFSLKIY